MKKFFPHHPVHVAPSTESASSNLRSAVSRLAVFAFIGATSVAWLPNTAAHAATTYYVAKNGNDASSTGNSSNPYLTIQKAASVTAAGDTVIVRDGTYRERVKPPKSGSQGAYITFRSANRGSAKVICPLANDYEAAFMIYDKSFIAIDGFDCSSERPAFGGNNRGNTASGIKTIGSHHIKITNNFCHDNDGSGISANSSDYILIQGNTATRNCRRSTKKTSGISIFKQLPITTGAQGWTNSRIEVIRNKSYGNYHEAGYDLTPDTTTSLGHSDANGIIIDTSPELSDCLVANNLCYANGGRGVHVVGSSNVNVFFNTCHKNNQDADVEQRFGVRGEITADEVTWDIEPEKYNKQTTNIKVKGNIAFADDQGGRAIYIDTRSDDGDRPGVVGSVIDENLVWSTSFVLANNTVGTNYVLAAPLLNPDFTLRSVSPAIDQLSDIGINTDHTGAARPAYSSSGGNGGPYDMGAYEFRSAGGTTLSASSSGSGGSG